MISYANSIKNRPIMADRAVCDAAGNDIAQTYSTGPESFTAEQIAYLKQALGVDETVLWTGSASGVNAQMNLSEAYSNFEYVLIYMSESNISIPLHVWRSGDTTGSTLYPTFIRTNSNKAQVNALWTLAASNSNTTLTITVATTRTNNAESANNDTIVKIVGVHRIAGGN